MKNISSGNLSFLAALSHGYMASNSLTMDVDVMLGMRQCLRAGPLFYSAIVSFSLLHVWTCHSKVLQAFCGNGEYFIILPAYWDLCQLPLRRFMPLGICNAPYTFHHTSAIWIKQHPHDILVSTKYLDYEEFHVYSSNASVFTTQCSKT